LSWLRRIVNYTPGDYSTSESNTTTVNFTETIIEEGDTTELMNLLEYQLAKATLTFKIEFKMSSTTVKAICDTSDNWLIIAMARCKDRADLRTCDSDLVRLAVFLDE
jgi:hypothetical protein